MNVDDAVDTKHAHHLLAAPTWELREDDKRGWARKAGQSGGGVEGGRRAPPNQGNRESGVNVQDGKLSRLEAEDGEEGEADDKESEGSQVEAAE